MTEPDQIQQAQGALTRGDFQKAWEVYGGLLELFPDDAEYQCGLYTAGYWSNRTENIARQKAGRPRGAFLFKEWDAFQIIAEDKDYTGCLSFQAAMRYILGNAAEEFRLAFQEEGGRSMDARLLIDLARCLIRIQDYQNAAEILQYGRRIHRGDARILFLLGESLCSINSEEELVQGIAFYRDAFILDPKEIDPSLIASDPIAQAFEKLYEEKDKNLDDTLEWLPAHIMARLFKPGIRRLPEHELDRLETEALRLSRDLQSVIEKFRNKVRARLSFYYLVLLHHSVFPTKDYARSEDFEAALLEVAPDVHRLYKETIAAG